MASLPGLVVGCTGWALGWAGTDFAEPGPPACWLVHQHFERFLLGADPRNTNHLFEQMYRASMFYGRKGLPVAVISVIDLALWDLLGKIRNEPVYKLIGGSTKDRIDFYCTGPDAQAAKEMGFWGAKVPLPYCPEDGHVGLKKNIEFLRRHRESVGPDFPLMVELVLAKEAIISGEELVVITAVVNKVTAHLGVTKHTPICHLLRGLSIPTPR